MEFKPIYSDRENLLQELMETDIIEKFEGAMGTVYKIGSGIEHKNEWGKIMPVIGNGVSFDTPWVHVKMDEGRNCNAYTELFFKCGIIPRHCFDSCWKVIVKPSTVKELFLLCDLMEYMKDKYENCWCKCGTEQRRYVEASYGGYFYNNSRKDGIARAQQVMLEVEKHIGKDLADAVYLKRGCSEMELKFGNSRFWKKEPSFDRWEDRYNELFAPKSADSVQKQPQFVKEHVMLQWLKFATERGDKTAMFFNKGKNLYITMQKYYERGQQNGSN